MYAFYWSNKTVEICSDTEAKRRVSLYHVENKAHARAIAKEMKAKCWNF